jgi:hypothetical protein
MLFASREEVLRFAHLDERLERGAWRPDLRANGLGECALPTCRRRPAPLNTDDNALIEFAAPRDLIGFDAFSGYVETMYAEDWTYGRVERELNPNADATTRARSLANLAVSLLAAGRPSRAGRCSTTPSPPPAPREAPWNSPSSAAPQASGTPSPRRESPPSDWSRRSRRGHVARGRSPAG